MPDKIDREELRRIVQEKVQAEIAAGLTPDPRRVKGAVSVALAARGRKTKQSEVRRQVKAAVREALRLRRFVARIRHARISPRKMRRVNQLIRGKDVNAADAILKTVPQRGAVFQKKLLQSAVANATYLAGAERTELDVNRLHIVETQIPPGPIMYRARPSSERHPYRIRKRFSHAIVVLEERDLPAPKRERGKKQQAVAAAEPPAPAKPAPKAASAAPEKPAEPKVGSPPEAETKKTTRRTATQPRSGDEPLSPPSQRATTRRSNKDTNKDKGEQH